MVTRLLVGVLVVFLLRALWSAAIAAIALLVPRCRNSRGVFLLGMPLTWAYVAGGVGAGYALCHRIEIAFLLLSLTFLGRSVPPAENAMLVWWKRRQRRRGKPIAGVWEDVADDYRWRLRRTRGRADAPTELLSAEAPAGRGTEVEAAPPRQERA